MLSIHYLHFSFEKQVPSQVLKDFSVENLETTPSTFRLNFFGDLFIPIMIYWDSVFTLYLMWGAFSLCSIRVFFPYFSCFPLPPAHEHSFSSSRFLPLPFNRSIYNYQTPSWRGLFSLEICILFGFSLLQINQSYWLWHFKVTFVRIWADAKLSPFYYKENALNNWDWHP